VAVRSAILAITWLNLFTVDALVTSRTRLLVSGDVWESPVTGDAFHSEYRTRSPCCHCFHTKLDRNFFYPSSS